MEGLATKMLLPEHALFQKNKEATTPEPTNCG